MTVTMIYLTINTGYIKYFLKNQKLNWKTTSELKTNQVSTSRCLNFTKIPYLEKKADHENHSKTWYDVGVILNKKFATENWRIFSAGSSF